MAITLATVPGFAAPAKMAGTAPAAEVSVKPTDFLGQDFRITKNDPVKAQMREFFETLLVERPRKKAAGQWIDAIANAQPVKPDIITPALPEKALYGDLNAVNAHWETFLVRNPATATWLLRHLGEPPQVTQKFVKEGTPEGSVARMALSKRLYSDYHHEAMTALGEGLLMADFLAARGGETGQAAAVQQLAFMRLTMSDRLAFHTEDLDLSILVAEEMIWPLLDSRKQRFDETLARFMRDAYRKKAGRTPKLLQMDKWLAGQDGITDGFLRQIYEERRQAYADVDDKIGVLLCLHAISSGTKGNAHTSDTFNRVRGKLIEILGPQIGTARFRKYLAILAAAKETKTDAVTRAVLREDINVFKEAKQFSQAITCLKQLDPEGKNAGIQKEIESLLIMTK
jgi:hypothetical protein